jgi:hypothetical protein
VPKSPSTISVFGDIGEKIAMTFPFENHFLGGSRQICSFLYLALSKLPKANPPPIKAGDKLNYLTEDYR